jgi:TetR/AcrR family transcriptional repressor of bet genes
VPKQVDHAARRRDLAEALWRLVGRDGFEGVSLRHVAAEAGVSMGLVQHYFRTKDDMLVFALDTMEQRTGDRFMAALAELPDPPPPRAAVHAFLTQMLPLDPERRAESRSLSVMMGGLARSERIDERLRAGMVQLEDYVAEQIAEADGPRDPHRAAAMLIALTEGMAAHVLGGHVPGDVAVAILDEQLDAVFGAEPDQAGADQPSSR